jgi:hypothetical protein
LCIDDDSSVLIGQSDDKNVIEFSVMECEDGTHPTDSDMKMWKDGKVDLWLCNYSATVKRVVAEDDFDVEEELKRESGK